MYDVVGCSVVALLLYLNTLSADFAYDDTRAILKNQDLLPTTPISNIFYDDFWGTPLVHSGSHKSFRPLCILSYRINYLLAGLEPFGYHLGNVLLHVAVTALFTYTARTVLLRRAFPSLLAGLLFAVHPIHTEAVAGIVGRADVGACLFFLLSFLCYVNYCRVRDRSTGDITGNQLMHKPWCYLILSVLLATMSMLTKEHGMTVLGVNAAYDIFIQNRMRLTDVLSLKFLSKDKRHLREGLVSQALGVVILLSFRLHFMGNTAPHFALSDNPAASNSHLLTRFMTFLHLPVLNLWLLFFPHRLSFDWSMEAVQLIESPTDIRNLLTVFFYGSLAAGVLLCCREMDSLHVAESQLLNCGTINNLTRLNGKLKAIGHCNGVVVSTEKTNGHVIRNGAQLGKNGHHTPKNGYAYVANSLSLNNCNSNGTARHENGLRKRQNNQRRTYHTPPPSPTNAPAVPPNVHERRRTLNAVVAGVLLTVLPFIPATNLFFYVGFVIAERILYIPSMGFCILVAEAVHQVWRRSKGPHGRTAVVASVAAVFVLLSFRTWARNYDWQSEESLYRSGIDVNPPKAWGNLANILKSQGNTAEAEEAYRKALSYRGNMADVHYNLGILLQESDRHEEALYSYRKAIECRPKLSMAHLNLGIVLNTLGRPADAEAVYRHAATLDDSGLKDPKNQMTGIISSLFNLGRMLQDQARYEEALNVFMEAIGRRPAHYSPQSLYNMLGETYFKLGRNEDAERWFKKSLEAKPDHVPAHVAYAYMLGKMNQPVEAETLLKRAIELDANNHNIYQHYGQFLHSQGRHGEAVITFTKAFNLHSDDYDVTFHLANALRQTGDNLEAEGLYKKAASLKPEDATSHMNLGAMYHLNGKLNEAESSYTTALRLKPNEPTTMQNLRKLRSLMAKKDLKKLKAEQRWEAR